MDKLIEFLKKLKSYNRDLIMMYRLTIYTSRNALRRYRFFRYIYLLFLVIKKYIFRQNLLTGYDRLKKGPCLLNESLLSNRRNLFYLMKNIADREIIYLDIMNLLFMPMIQHKTDLSLIFERVRECNQIQSYLDVCEVNPYGQTIYSVLEQNEKNIYMICEDESIPMDELKQFLSRHEYGTYKDILYCSADPEIRREFLIEQERLRAGYHTFVYIGSYVPKFEAAQHNSWIISPYNSCAFWGEPFRPESSGNLNLSVYCALINNALHNGSRRQGFFFAFGYRFVGIITYYVCVQMIKNQTSFKVEQENLYRVLFQKIKSPYLTSFLKIVFPDYVNNLAYDGTELHNYSDYDIRYSCKKQKKIQHGAIHFITDYEKKLLYITGQNDIRLEEVLSVINFFLKNDRVARKIVNRMLKNDKR